MLSLEGAGVLDFLNKRWIGGLNLLANRSRHHKSEIFEAMIEDLNQQEVDHVLVTGDITNVALDEEFRFARELFKGFSLGPENITVLPGNHDAYVQVGATYFTSHFGEYFASDASHQEGHLWPCIRRRGPVSIFGLSTSLQTPWFTAYGVIGDEQLGRLRTALMAPEFEDTLRLVAIHHSPAEPRARSRVRGLRDRAKLYTVLKEAGAELILHGHEHLDLTADLPGANGRIPVRGIQSATYDAGDQAPHKRGGYRIYEIADTCEPGKRPAMVGEELRLWDSSSQSFAKQEPQTTVSAVS